VVKRGRYRGTSRRDITAAEGSRACCPDPTMYNRFVTRDRPIPVTTRRGIGNRDLSSWSKLTQHPATWPNVRRFRHLAGWRISQYQPISANISTIRGGTFNDSMGQESCLVRAAATSCNLTYGVETLMVEREEDIVICSRLDAP
jgi:hypothetical protein